MKSELKNKMKRLIALFLLTLCLPFFTFASLVFAADAPQVQELTNSGLVDILQKNRDKVIMLNFFATWCPPCRVELPELVKLRADYPENQLLVLGLSVDENKAAVAPFLVEAGVNYPVFMAKKEITDKFNISSVPHNAFFAPGGDLVISEPGMADVKVMKEVVDDLLKRK